MLFKSKCLSALTINANKTVNETFGLDPSLGDAGQDPDGEGFTNLEEYLVVQIKTMLIQDLLLLCHRRLCCFYVEINDDMHCSNKYNYSTKGAFRTHVVPHGKRYEDALRHDLWLLFLTGISTRSLSMISKKLIGRGISTGKVSNVNKQLIEAAEKW